MPIEYTLDTLHRTIDSLIKERDTWRQIGTSNAARIEGLVKNLVAAKKLVREAQSVIRQGDWAREARELLMS